MRCLSGPGQSRQLAVEDGYMYKRIRDGGEAARKHEAFADSMKTSVIASKKREESGYECHHLH